MFPRPRCPVYGHDLRIGSRAGDLCFHEDGEAIETGATSLFQSLSGGESAAGPQIQQDYSA
jgi:hypothetical protein